MTKAQWRSSAPMGKRKNSSPPGLRSKGECGPPAGDEIWFAASNSGGADNMRGVTLAGKLRTICNVPGGMWLKDVRNGVVLTVSQQQRLGIRGMPPEIG